MHALLDPGVRQACIDVVPALKGDGRVKKHKLAVFRLQQYNQILQVCLCPAVIYLLLPLVVLCLITEKIDRKSSLKSVCSSCLSDVGNGSTSRNHFLPSTRLSSSSITGKKHQKKMQIVCRAVMGMQLLLLKAGDIESNPGPKGMRLHGY